MTTYTYQQSYVYIEEVHCGKTADRIRMPFGTVGRTGPGMRQVVGFGDRSTGRGTFGGEFEARHCPQGPIGRTCATAPRCGPLAVLLWADLLLNLSMNRQFGAFNSLQFYKK